MHEGPRCRQSRCRGRPGCCCSIETRPRKTRRVGQTRPGPAPVVVQYPGMRLEAASRAAKRTDRQRRRVEIKESSKIPSPALSSRPRRLHHVENSHEARSTLQLDCDSRNDIPSRRTHFDSVAPSSSPPRRTSRAVKVFPSESGRSHVFDRVSPHLNAPVLDEADDVSKQSPLGSRLRQGVGADDGLAHRVPRVASREPCSPRPSFNRYRVFRARSLALSFSVFVSAQAPLTSSTPSRHNVERVES